MYVQKRVSVLAKNGRIETWGPTTGTASSNGGTSTGNNNTTALVAATDGVNGDGNDGRLGDDVVERKSVLPNLPNVPEPVHCWEMCEPKYTVWSSYLHFYGPEKPWAAGYPRDGVTERNKFQTPVHYWFYVLKRLNDEYGAGIDVKRFKTDKGDLSHRSHPNVSTKTGHWNGTLTNLLD